MKIRECKQQVPNLTFAALKQGDVFRFTQAPLYSNRIAIKLGSATEGGYVYLDTGEKWNKPSAETIVVLVKGEFVEEC
jgi:hypothetical protein